MLALRLYDWPGNIRELQNLIERAVILTRGSSLEAPLGELRKANTDIPIPSVVEKYRQIVTENVDSRNDKNGIVEEYARKQRDEIARALSECSGRVGGADGAAARLGINRTTLLSRMKKFGIHAKQYG